MIDLTLSMVGRVPPDGEPGNGMGTTKTGWLVRLLLWFAQDALPVLDAFAARWHDHGYRVGGCEQDRTRIDGEFWLNVRTCLQAVWPWWKRLLLMRLTAWACYRAVRDFGWAAFHYQDTNERDRMVSRGVNEQLKKADRISKIFFWR